VISGVQRDGLGDHPHIALKSVEPQVYVLELRLGQISGRWVRLQELFKGRFDDHALAAARTHRFSLEALVDFLGKSDGDLAAGDGFPFGKGWASRVGAATRSPAPTAIRGPRQLG